MPPDVLYGSYLTPSAWKFEPHTFSLITRIQKLINVESNILDVGCNNGKFLVMLSQAGFISLHGLEPTENTVKVALSHGLSVTHGFLTPSTAEGLIKDKGLFDCLILRQVLERIVDLQEFGIALNSLTLSDSYLIIEVPNFEQNLRNLDYTFWEEHPNYFTPETLVSWLNSFGFSVLESYTTLFSGECLTITAQKSAKNNDESNRPLSSSSAFAKLKVFTDAFEPFRQATMGRLRQHASRGPIILHGVGARSSFWLNATGTSALVSLAADNQSAKRGKYMPQSNIPIVSAEDARQLNPSLVLLGVNTENEHEVTPIWDDVAPVNSILPPSSILLWRDLLV